jgi:hypothetical protein
MSEQLADKIILDGVEMALYSNPLEQYWTGRKKPDFLVTPECRRGYVATWEILDEELFLKDITGLLKPSFMHLRFRLTPCTLKRLFPASKRKPVKAVWFTGRLRIPDGKMTRFDDHDYDSRFERDIIITIDEGSVIRRVILDNAEHALIEDSK